MLEKPIRSWQQLYSAGTLANYIFNVPVYKTNSTICCLSVANPILDLFLNKQIRRPENLEMRAFRNASVHHISSKNAKIITNQGFGQPLKDFETLKNSCNPPKRVTSLRQSDVMSRDRPTFWHPQKAARSSNIGNMKSKSNKTPALFLDLERADAYVL